MVLRLLVFIGLLLAVCVPLNAQREDRTHRILGEPDQMLRSETTTVVVNGGVTNGLVPYGGLFRYHDHAHGNEETTWSVDPVLISPRGRAYVLSRRDHGGFADPKRVDENLIRCETAVDGVEVSVDFELVGSNCRQTYRFKSPTSLENWTFLYYAENDLFGHANDIASYTGTLQSDDLKLFMYDSAAGGLSVKLSGVGLEEAKLTKFGAGIWTRWGELLERGSLRGLSEDGRNFERYGDMGLALAFELEGESPVVLINYDSQPEPPDDPQSLQYLQANQGASPPRSRGAVDPQQTSEDFGAVPKGESAAEEHGAASKSERPAEDASPVATKDRWRLKNGNVIRGVFVSANKRYGTIVLRGQDGRSMRLRIDQFDDDEQEELRPLLK